jgi:hypothetical protein
MPVVADIKELVCLKQKIMGFVESHKKYIRELEEKVKVLEEEKK